MRNRSKAREYALQMLYQVDIRHADCRQILQEFWRDHERADEIKQFANQLLQGTVARLAEIDALITAHAPALELPDWRGDIFSLDSLRGTKVLLVAWASW